MKKLIYLVLVVTVLVFSSTAIYGADITTTSTSTISRNDFVTSYLEKMGKIVDLRTKTETARVENNTLTGQIRDTRNSNTTKTEAKNKVTQVKQIQQTNKSLLEQAKTYAAQRVEVRKQWSTVVRSKDTQAMANLKAEIDKLTSQIEDIRSQIKANIDKVAPLMSDLKTYKDNVKSNEDQAKKLLDQIKTIQEKITSEIIAKDKLWTDFGSQVRAKNYDQALITMDNIITAKQQVLDDINSKNTLLNELAALQK